LLQGLARWEKRLLAGALAAGNSAVLKPSELAPHSAEAVAGMAADLFPADYCRVVTRGPDAARDLLCALGPIFSRAAAASAGRWRPRPPNI